jgi:hypothetical protein
MDELQSRTESREQTEQTVTVTQPQATGRKLAWETPKLEDVSEQVMAQPYIRFT